MAGEPSAPTNHRSRVIWEGTKDDLRVHRIELSGQTVLASSMPERGGDAERADPEGYAVTDLHHAAHELCFLANSVTSRSR